MSETASGSGARGFGLILGRHLSVPAGSPYRSDRTIRRLERRLEGALARLLGPERRMRSFGADRSGERGLYLRAWRETLADGAAAEVGAYYRPDRPGDTEELGLRPGTVHWTLQVSGGRDRRGWEERSSPVSSPAKV